MGEDGSAPATRVPPQPLEQRLELLRLRGAGHRLELALARQELGDRTAGMRRALALVAAILRSVWPGRRQVPGENLPRLRLAALLAPLLVRVLLRPLLRRLFGRRRRRGEAGTP